MPIYEYEPTEHDCLMCSGRVEVLQAIEDPALEFCPTCGLPVRRVISKASIAKHSSRVDYDKAARRGFTTFRRAERGKWERIAGDGVDGILASPEDEAKLKEESTPKRTLDLDQDP